MSVGLMWACSLGHVKVDRGWFNVGLQPGTRQGRQGWFNVGLQPGTRQGRQGWFNVGLQSGTRQGRQGIPKNIKIIKHILNRIWSTVWHKKNGQIIHVLNTKCFRWTDSDGRRLHQHNQYDFFIVDKLFSQVIVEKLF